MKLEGFGFVYRRAVDESDLEHKAWCVAVALAQRANSKHGWTCYPSIETLADDTRMSKRAVVNALKALRQAGWVTGTRGSRRSGKANTYSIEIPATYGKHKTRRDREAVGRGLSAGSALNQSAIDAPSSAPQTILSAPQTILSAPRAHQSPMDLPENDQEEEGATATLDGMLNGDAGPQPQPTPEQSSQTAMVESRPPSSAAPPVDRLAYLVALNAAMKANGESLRPAWMRLDAVHGSDKVAEVVAWLHRARRYPEPAEDELVQRAQRHGTFTEQVRYNRCLELVRVLGWRRCRDGIALDAAAIGTREDLSAALWANRAASRALIQAAPGIEAPPFRRVLAARLIDADDFGEAEWSQVWERCPSVWAWERALTGLVKTPDMVQDHARGLYKSVKEALTACGIESTLYAPAEWLDALRDDEPHRITAAYRQRAFSDPSGMRDALDSSATVTATAAEPSSEVESKPDLMEESLAEAKSTGEGVAKLRALIAEMDAKRLGDATEPEAAEDDRIAECGFGIIDDGPTPEPPEGMDETPLAEPPEDFAEVM